MKLHHLLQKCSFFLIKMAAFQASGVARMKLGQNGTVSFSIRLDARGQRLSLTLNLEPLNLNKRYTIA